MSKILVVEDDKKIALALSLRLKANGHEVLIAQDALGGLSLASQKSPTSYFWISACLLAEASD